MAGLFWVLRSAVLALSFGLGPPRCTCFLSRLCGLGGGIMWGSTGQLDSEVAAEPLPTLRIKTTSSVAVHQNGLVVIEIPESATYSDPRKGPV